MEDAQAIQYLIDRIKSHKKIFVLGFLKDKPVEKIIKLFPKDGTYFFSSPKILTIKKTMLNV